MAQMKGSSLPPIMAKCGEALGSLGGLLLASTLEPRPLLLPRSPWSAVTVDELTLCASANITTRSDALMGSVSRGFPVDAPS